MRIQWKAELTLYSYFSQRAHPLEAGARDAPRSELRVNEEMDFVGRHVGLRGAWSQS